MNKLIIAIVLGAVVGTLSAKPKVVKSAKDIVKSYNQGYPYETKVDRTTIPGKTIHWYSDGHSVTVTPHRVNCVYLTNTVDEAVITVKNQKKAQKEGKKDAKNLEKAVKEIEKLRDKSSSALTPLFDEAIKMFNGALESSK